MGRFYETSQPHFIDNKMYQAPAELMANVLMNKEKAVDDTIASANSYLEKLKAESLIQDTPALQKRIADYEGKISGIVENIQANPMEYSKYTGDITKLGRDISADWTTGPIGTMQTNKKKAEAEIQILNDHLKAHPEDANYVAIKKKEIFSGYENGLGYDDATKQSTGTLKVDGTYYHPEFDDKFLAQMKAKGKKVERDTVSGAWINTSSDDNKILTQEEIQQAYLAAASADVNYQTALNDWSTSGVAGYEDVDINRAYNTSVNKEGQKVRSINQDNFFGRKAQAAGIAYEVKEEDTRDSIKGNPNYWSEKEWAEKQREKEIQNSMMVGVSKDKTYVTRYDKDTNTAYTTNQAELDLINQRWGVSLGELAGDAGYKFKPGEKNTMGKVREKIKYLKKTAKTAEDKALVQGLQDRLNVLQGSYRTTLPTGYADLAPQFGIAASEAIRTEMQTVTKDPGNIYNVKQDWKFYSKKLGRGVEFKNITFYQIAANPEKYGLNKQDFAAVQAPEETEVSGIGARGASRSSKGLKQPPRIPNYLIEGSDRPEILSGNPADWEENKINFDYEVNGVSLQSSAKFKDIGLKKVTQ
jgi:hypothetical protein